MFNFSRDSEQLVGVTSSVMLILLDSIFDHKMSFKHITYSKESFQVSCRYDHSLINGVEVFYRHV